MVVQVESVVVEVEDSVAVAVEVAVVLVVVVVVAVAVDDEGTGLAAWQVVVPWVIVVCAFVPVERNHSVVVFRADWRMIDNGKSTENQTRKKKPISPLPQEMYCSVYSGVEEVAFAEDHPSALVDPALA